MVHITLIIKLKKKRIINNTSIKIFYKIEEETHKSLKEKIQFYTEYTFDISRNKKHILIEIKNLLEISNFSQFFYKLRTNFV